VGYPTVHTGRLAWVAYTHLYTGRLAWVAYTPHTHREASLGGIYLPTHPGRLAWVAYTSLHPKEDHGGHIPLYTRGRTMVGMVHPWVW